jgi:hypothetical protein
MRLIGARDLPEDSREMLVLTRAILGVATDPGVPLTTKAMAEALGMTPDALRAVLVSPLYRTLVFEEFKVRIEGALSRGVQVMDDIVCDERRKTADRIQAHKANVATYAALAGKVAPAEDDDAVKKLEIMLKKLADGTKPKEAS